METLAQDVDRTGDFAGVSSSVPGFPDSLVAIAATENSALDRILWPTRGEPSIRAMAQGDGVALDANAQFIALTSTVPGLDGMLLSMGRFNLIRATSPGVTSYVWHDSESGLLSYTTEDESGSHLHTVTPRGLKGEIPRAFGPGAAVVGFGDWGWAIQESPDLIVLLSPNGEFKDSEAGRVFASHESGWIFAMDGADAKLISSGGGVQLVVIGSDLGIVADAKFSPDGTLIAVAGSKGILIVDRHSDRRQVLRETSTSWVSWSSDSRFVLSSASTGVVVHDVDSGDSTTVLDNFAIVVAKVVPDRS